MTRETPKELFDRGFITEEQFKKIDLITSGKLISVFYELRTLLYLGVMLFTTGVGILVYQNIGEFGHIVAIFALIILTAVCFSYIFKQALSYSSGEIKSPTPYFDYVVLLGSLLFISIQAYLQFRFGWLDENLGMSTLVTAAFFFYVAYRFDHAGVLSLAITALASFWSNSVSPQKWYSGDFFSGTHLYVTAIIFSTVLGTIALGLDYRSIKKHFTFTYLNFCALIFFVGAITGLFVGERYGLYMLIIYAGCAVAYYAAQWKRSFMFLLYAFIAAYIATTYFFSMTIFKTEYTLWFPYSIASCGGFIFFIVKYKSYFSQHD